MTRFDVQHLQSENLNLNNLEIESIHKMGQIQSHGVLLVLEEPDLKILQVSQNT